MSHKDKMTVVDEVISTLDIKKCEQTRKLTFKVLVDTLLFYIFI